MNPQINALLFDAGVALGATLLAGCAIFGLLLLLIPETTMRWSARLNRNVSGRRAMRAFEIPHSTEAFVYRHHRIVGALLFVGVAAFYLLYFFGFPKESVLAELASRVGRPLAETFVESFTGFLLVANALIAVLAAFMIVRPSMLKPVEAIANRWLSTRKLMRGAEEPRMPVDRLASRRPRLTGFLILAASAYVAGTLLFTFS